MSLTSGDLRDKLVPGSSASRESSDAVLAALEGKVEQDEQLEYRIPGKSGIVREQDGETEEVKKPRGGKSLALITDQKLLFVLAGPDQKGIREISYTNVRSAGTDEGLFGAKLIVRVWGEGEYRFKVADSDDLHAAVDYIEGAADCWQRVVSAVEEATTQTEQMGECLENGNLDAADEARKTAVNKFTRSRRYLDEAAIDPPQPLVDRIESAAVEHQRTEIRNRLTRAENLITEATYQADAREYTGAYRSYMDARDHLQTARSLAEEIDIPEPPAIEGKLETIDNRLRHLRVRPLALAKQACERAEGTEKLDVEVESWEAAFGHYRDALTAGWGTELDFEGDTWDIRPKIEMVVEKLIDRRRKLGIQHEQRGDEDATADPAGAIEQYEAALDQLQQAHQLASEFRAGEKAQLDTHLDRVAGKRLDLR